MADFITNFVTMATRVGRGKISLTSFNMPTPNNPHYPQGPRLFPIQKPSNSRCCLRFRLTTRIGRGRI